MQSASTQALSKVSALKWLVLVALAWSQLSLAAHDIRHQPAELDEGCEICLQVDRDGDVLADPACAGAQSVNGVSADSSAAPRRLTERVTRFRARASP